MMLGTYMAITKTMTEMQAMARVSLGVSAATIGGFIGSSIGSVVDSWIISSLAPTQRIEGARLDTLRITSATEGAVIPQLYGRMRMGGNIIWATDFREETKTTTQGGGKGGGGGKVKTTEYLYYASFAVALCEGPITGIGRIWADGKPLDMTGITWRWYRGDDTQGADPFIHQASTGRVLMAPGEEGWEDRLDEPVPVFTDVVEMTLALCAVGAAWAGADEPFTPDWHVRPEVTDAVVGGLTGVLGSAERAVPLARALGYPAAG